jgi:sarcosine oxidase
LGDGVKAALHHEGKSIDPDFLRPEVNDDDTRAVRTLLARFVPRAAGRLQSAEVCMYTNAPDSHFILGHHPVYPQVVIASPCSGHGFKFSTVIGELAAVLINDRRPSFDLSLFTPERF